MNTPNLFLRASNLIRFNNFGEANSAANDLLEHMKEASEFQQI